MKKLILAAVLAAISVPAYAQMGGFKITIEVEPLPGPPQRAAPAVEAEFTEAHMADLATAMRRCWFPPVDAVTEGEPKVRVGVALNRNGSVAGISILTPIIDELVRSTAFAAQRAVERCAPYTMLPVGAYDKWKMIDVTFDPTDVR